MNTRPKDGAVSTAHALIYLIEPEIPQNFAELSGRESRRNLHPDQASYLRGKRYNEEVQARRADRAKRSRHRESWLLMARRQFAPGEKMPCFVCGEYKDIAQAHHLAPLSLQYSVGRKEPIQEFNWLCPNHHALVHVAIDLLMTAASVEQPPSGVEITEWVQAVALATTGIEMIAGVGA